MVRGYHPMTDKYTQLAKANGGKEQKILKRQLEKVIILKYSI